MKEFNDILRIDITDSYADLTGKTLRMFAVLPQKIEADFYFKVDDDVAVNIDAMEYYLTQQRTQGNLYMVRGSFPVMFIFRIQCYHEIPRSLLGCVFSLCLFRRRHVGGIYGF